MSTKVTIQGIYMPSKNVVAREIEGELIMVPVTSGIGDLEDALFTLNETGRALWDKLNGKKNLTSIAKDLSLEYGVSLARVEKDILGFSQELLKRKMLVEVKRS